MARTVVTFSRQMGAWGEEIALRVADKLGVPRLDREILTRAASTAGVSEEAIQEAEHVPSFLVRMVELLGRYPLATELGTPMADLPMPPAMSTDSYRKLIEEVIRGVADRGGAVIVGHGGQVVLKDYPYVLRVFMYAPFKMRVARLMAEEGIPAPQAQRQLQEKDREWGDYIHSYYHANWTDPQLYDLMINTGRLNIDACVDTVLRAAQSIEG